MYKHLSRQCDEFGIAIARAERIEPSQPSPLKGSEMKVSVFSTKPYDATYLQSATANTSHELVLIESRLTTDTAKLAADSNAVCVFVNDDLGREVLAQLAGMGVRTVALRCAGFNNVDLAAADELGMHVVRVPAYSPYAVAEHCAGLILTLNRNIHRAYSRVRDGNFMLSGLLGFDLKGRTVGIIGTGTIGSKFAKIMTGFGCRLLGVDLEENPECLNLGLTYVDLPELYAQSDIIALHCPLTPKTHHLIDAAAIEQMKDGVMIINTSRGAVVDTKAIIGGLKSGKIGHVGLDVYEEEADVFFEDLSNEVIPDDMLSRLLTFPNVLITGHQGFFTRDALTSIAETTIDNLTSIETSGRCKNSVALVTS